MVFSIECHKKAMRIDVQTYGENHPDVAIDWNNLGLAWEYSLKYDEAIRCYEEAIKIANKIEDPNKKSFIYCCSHP